MGYRVVTVKRRLTKLAVFLLLGAIVNVAVAWGLCFQPVPDPISVFVNTRPATDSDLTWVRELEWKSLADTGDWIGTEFISEVKQVGVTHRRISENWLPTAEWGRDMRHPPRWDFALEVSAGWPLRTVLGRALDARALGRTKIPLDIGLTNGVLIGTYYGTFKDPITANSFILARRASPKGVVLARLIPLRPVWGGLLFNTFFYATLLWLVTLGPFTARRMIRRKRGRCTKCGYDLRGAEHEVCPECGVTTL